MQLGRYIIETHCHAQRHAVKFSQRNMPTSYQELAKQMHYGVPAEEADEDDDVIVYDVSDRVLYDMERYGVDMALLLAFFGMTNEMNKEMIDEHPDKFIAAAYPQRTKKEAMRTGEWTIDDAIDEVEYWLDQDGFKLIGESIPNNPTLDEPMTWEERREEVLQWFAIADKHDVPIRWHTGILSGYGGTRTWNYYPDWKNPLLAQEILMEYPDVPVIFDHGGMQGHWIEEYVDNCCQVAASFDNVYLEIGLYWADLLNKPLNDPNIGPEQLLWGTDWGASIVEHSQPHDYPPMYWDQIKDRGLPAHQVDYWGSSFRQLLKYSLEYNLPQDDLNLILGGNACRLLDIEPPEKRLFPEYVEI